MRSNKRNIKIIRTVVFIFSAVGFWSGVLAQTTQICVPGTVSDCKVCNVVGSDWINDNLKCSQGQICVDGACVSTCKNECVVAGAKMCFGAGYQVCAVGASGCLKWSGVFNCSAGQICISGACVKNTATSISSPGAAVNLQLFGFLPAGILHDPKINLAVETSIAANCRYDLLDRNFNLMANDFSTADYFRHRAGITVSKAGNYDYYVRCKDKDGNIGSGKISFIYSSGSTGLPDKTAVADKKAPIISGLLPSGQIGEAQIVLACATDEPAICNYDIADVDYDAMENSMSADEGGLNHSRKIDLENFGEYAYYVRCRDRANNANNVSVKISFEYVQSQIGQGPLISNLFPYGNGNIYQKDIILTANTDQPSECRYNTADVNFDQMADVFNSDDKLFHEAVLTLGDFGAYHYYIRCKNEFGIANATSTVASFEYLEAVPVSAENQQTACQNYSHGEKDGSCNNSADCVCDPDCGVGENGNDQDCLLSPVKIEYGWKNFLISGVAIFILVAIAAFAVFIMKKKRKEFSSENLSPTYKNEDKPEAD